MSDKEPAKFLSMSLLLEDFLSRDQEEFVKNHPYALIVIDNPGEEVENASFQTIAKSPSGDTTSAKHERLLDRVGRWVYVLKRKGKFASMITIGRAANSDLRLNVPSVSKFHAYFTYVAREKCWFLADANSSNGTFVNGDELPPSHGKVKLLNGTMLRFGPDVTAKFFDAAGIWAMLNERITDTPDEGVKVNQSDAGDGET